jgi:hypothetical protein
LAACRALHSFGLVRISMPLRGDIAVERVGGAAWPANSCLRRATAALPISPDVRLDLMRLRIRIKRFIPVALNPLLAIK